MSVIIIGADLVPTASNQQYFETGNMSEIVDSTILTELKSADYRIFNLEVPLTDKKDPLKKCGPKLSASTLSVEGYKALGVDFLTLANNHILDQGKTGILSTVDTLNAAEIAFAGVGKARADRSAPHIFTVDNKKIGIYCCAEHEFSVVPEGQIGANPFDALESLDDIAALKAECDYVICLYHGGKEHYRYPSPYLQRVCRKIAEKGADLVVCQHSHSIGCEEQYQNSTIVYGQGNFLFDFSETECWQTSLLIKLDLETGEVGYIPIVKNGNGVLKADGTEAENILKAFFDRSEQIKADGFIAESYSQYAEKDIVRYLLATSFICNSLPFRVLNRLLKNRLRRYIIGRIKKKHKYELINQYECEVHNETVLTYLKKP